MSQAGSFSRDPGTSEENIKNQVCDYISPVRWDPGITMPVSRLTELRFSHVIAFTETARLAWPVISNHFTPLERKIVVFVV